MVCQFDCSIDCPDSQFSYLLLLDLIYGELLTKFLGV